MTDTAARADERTDMEQVRAAMLALGYIVRCKGRRLDRDYLTSTARVVEETKGQNRKTRRNNLRIARLEVKARRKALAAADGVLVDGEPVT